MTALRFTVLFLLALTAIETWIAPLASAQEGKVKEAAAGKPAYVTRTPEEWDADVAEIVRLLNTGHSYDLKDAKRRLDAISDPNAAHALWFRPGIKGPNRIELRRLFLQPMARVGGDKMAVRLVNAAMVTVPRNTVASDPDAIGALADDAARALGSMRDNSAALPMLARYLQRDNSSARRALYNYGEGGDGRDAHKVRAVEVLRLSGLARPPGKDEPFDAALTLGMIAALTYNGAEQRRGAFGEPVGAPVVRPNPHALELLKQYTGQDLPLDKTAWLKWYRSLPPEKKRAPGEEWLIAPLPERTAEKGTYETRTPVEWRARLVALRPDLNAIDDKKKEAAIDALLAIHDPAALAPLTYMLQHESAPILRRYWVLALGGVAGEESVDLLADLAVKDEQATWEACAVLARIEERAKAVPKVVRYLRTKKYQAKAVQVLAAANLVQPLEPEQQPDHDLTHWLIDALALKSTVYYKGKFYYITGRMPGGTGAGGLRYRFLSPAYITTFAGYAVEKNFAVEVRTPNELAYRLLQQYTGENQLPLDQAAWTKWYREQAKQRGNRGR